MSRDKIKQKLDQVFGSPSAYLEIEIIARLLERYEDDLKAEDRTFGGMIGIQEGKFYKKPEGGTLYHFVDLDKWLV